MTKAEIIDRVSALLPLTTAPADRVAIAVAVCSIGACTQPELDEVQAVILTGRGWRRVIATP